MTPAELKTIRESLGLTAQWIADQVGVRLRTVQYWEAGRMSVPEDVETLLAQIDQSINQSVQRAVSSIEEIAAAQEGYPDDITLVRYRTDEDLWQFQKEMKPLPTTTHAAMLSRLRRSLWEKAIPSTIVYMEPEEYKAWLNGAADTEATRAQWAAEQTEA